MVADGLLIRRNINAVDLVIGDITFDPLHARQGANHAAGFLRDAVKIRGGELRPLGFRVRLETSARVFSSVEEL